MYNGSYSACLVSVLSLTHSRFVCLLPSGVVPTSYLVFLIPLVLKAAGFKRHSNSDFLIEKSVSCSLEGICKSAGQGFLESMSVILADRLLT